jgi:hypothetical protein
MGKVREDEFIDQEVRDYVVDFLSLGRILSLRAIAIKKPDG